MRWCLPSTATMPKIKTPYYFPEVCLKDLMFPVISVYAPTCLLSAGLDVAAHKLHTHTKHQHFSVTNWSWYNPSLMSAAFKNKGSKIFRCIHVWGPLKLSVLCWNQFMVSIARNSQSWHCDVLCTTAVRKNQHHINTDIRDEPERMSEWLFNSEIKHPTVRKFLGVMIDP